ncbi:hypothetical protein [Streptomyces sp. NPDC096339]|uniref:hypothetical protein n=1 Tax=Streptomyces sp. NPDC096339 TaxID=3366086 RepID=UPI00381D2FE7
MSKTVRLITIAFLTSVLSGFAAPLASNAYAATGPGGIGWDSAPAYTAATIGTSDHNGIGWD